MGRTRTDEGGGQKRRRRVPSRVLLRMVRVMPRIIGCGEKVYVADMADWAN
jgi:hypothetical protein